MTGEIEKAIQKSDLGLTPLNDGKTIRINIPPLTEERRRELVKVIRRMEEECKVALRNLRRDANEQLKMAKKNKSISEDDQFKFQDEVQKLIDKCIEKGEEIVKAKEKEILEI
jgi:ribosome recycling factor